MSSLRSVSILLLSLAGVLLPFRSVAQTPAVADEYRLKAAIIYRFPQFVEWPPAATAGRDALELCVAVPSPVGAALRQLASGEPPAGLRLEVREITRDESVATCHVLVASSQRADEMKQAAGRPILTIGESPGFLSDGGVIRLHVVDHKVRFEVDVAAATRAGLTLSSQLLRLASNVKGQSQ